MLTNNLILLTDLRHFNQAAIDAKDMSNSVRMTGMTDNESVSSHDYKTSLVLPSPLPTRNYQILIWLYNSFSLRYRNIKEMMLYRGVCVTYEAISNWRRKFSQLRSCSTLDKQFRQQFKGNFKVISCSNISIVLDGAE